MAHGTWLGRGWSGPSAATNITQLKPDPLPHAPTLPLGNAIHPYTAIQPPSRLGLGDLLETTDGGADSGGGSSAEGVGTTGVLLGAALALPDADGGALDGVLMSAEVGSGSVPCRRRGRRSGSAG